ncbi:PepSY-associated TM helix domain-containing protein [Achromobacter sp.]|uniref:PepSY-associated TM helix domain-containing protein n=1 Tax=Achromobacter sp. TaxID=134375 RepID=UPI003C72BEC9
MPRRIWLLCHRWVALGLGGILILSGLTGAFLVAARPLDRLLHPEFFQVGSASAGQPASFDSLRRNLAAEFGPQASYTFRPPREPGETMQVRVRAPDAWDGTVYLDPASGREQGRRGENEGIVALVYKLHSALMLEQTGKAVLAWTALAYLVLMVSGLVVWWPRKWPPSLRMAFNKGALRALFDLHRNGGAILALALAVCMASGAYMAWRPIGGWITLASGQTPVIAPKLPARPAGSIQPRSLDELAAAAQAAFPDGAIGYFLYTPRTDRPLAIRMIVPDDPHPNGRSTVWLDPRDGKVLAAQRWSQLDPGARINSVLYPLHTGELGGVAGEAIVALLGLGLGALGLSGIWLWWRRRSLRRQGSPNSRFPSP